MRVKLIISLEKKDASCFKIKLGNNKIWHNVKLMRIK